MGRGRAVSLVVGEGDTDAGTVLVGGPVSEPVHWVMPKYAPPPMSKVRRTAAAMISRRLLGRLVGGVATGGPSSGGACWACPSSVADRPVGDNGVPQTLQYGAGLTS